jgi:hypothetical protein
MRAVIGIDQSKKSTALHALDRHGETISYTLITPPIELIGENLICYQWDAIHEFISDIKSTHAIIGIAIEGAAFTMIGQANDLLWGIQWYVRTRILVEFDIEATILTAATWRSSILTRQELQSFKADYEGKIGLKHAAVSKLPIALRDELENYVYLERNRINLTKGKKDGSRSELYKEALYDLTDSWGLAKHLLYLHDNPHKVKAPVKKVKKRRKKISRPEEAPVIKTILVRRTK